MHTEGDRYTPEDLIAEIITILVVLAWFGVGIWLTHRTRKSECLIKIVVAVIFTKGFVIYWFCYALFYLPYKTLRKTVTSFRQGMKEGRAERDEADKK